jgi:hypothetical protein
VKRIGDFKQAAEAIGMSVSWVRQNMDQLPHYRVGRRVLFDLDELAAEFLDKHKHEPKGEGAHVN